MRFTKEKLNVRFKSAALMISLLALTGALYAQMEFPAGDFWSLDAGLGMSSFLVRGQAYQLVIDPKLWLSPTLMVGSKAGINYSFESESSSQTLGDILTFEGQVYLRWNFLRFGKAANPFYVFAQAGVGLISAYRGTNNPFDDATKTRGSVMADAALGITIPITSRWHIEPSVRGGYPHLLGFSVTAGYKFPLPKNTTTTINAFNESRTRTEYVEMIRTLPASEIIKRIMITSVEFILFGPDIGRYNLGIDADARQLNELVLIQTAQFLKDNPNTIVRIEGHVNPYTVNHYEIDELNVLSLMRAQAVADELRAKGIRDDQMVIISFGGSRAVTSELDIRNRNRRVELIIIQLDLD